MRQKLFGVVAIAALSMISCTPTNPTGVVIATPSVAVASPATPATPATPAESVLKSGTFIAGEHPTSGTVQIVDQSGEQSIVLGEDFQTSEMGPDLVVILHRAADILGSTRPPAYPLTEGSYIVLAPLQKFQGAQRYTIPVDVNLSDYSSAAIWCRRFNATFGAATLK